MAQFYLRLLAYFFTLFGLLVALPLMVWDVVGDRLPGIVALPLVFASVFLPIGAIAWTSIEADPGDAEVPVRMRQDAAVRASIATGLVLGAGAVVWLAF